QPIRIQFWWSKWPSKGKRMGQIQISNLTIEYKLLKGEGTFKAVDNVSLTVEAGELVTVVGSSGCGKSTLLLAIAGLVETSRGSINVAGKPITGPGPDRAVVFQESSLLPWKTVL